MTLFRGFCFGLAFAAQVYYLKEKITMNLNNFTIKAQEAVARAQQLAFNNANPNIETEHLLKALLADKDSSIEFLLKKNNVNVVFVDGKLDESIAKLPKVSGTEPAQALGRE